MLRLVSVVAIVVVSAALAQAQAARTRLSLRRRRRAWRPGESHRARKQHDIAPRRRGIRPGCAQSTASYSGDHSAARPSSSHFLALEQPIRARRQARRDLMPPEPPAGDAAELDTCAARPWLSQEGVHRHPCGGGDAGAPAKTSARSTGRTPAAHPRWKRRHLRARADAQSKFSASRSERDAADARQAIAAARIALRAPWGRSVAPDFTLGDLGFREVPLDASRSAARAGRAPRSTGGGGGAGRARPSASWPARTPGATSPPASRTTHRKREHVRRRRERPPAHIPTRNQGEIARKRAEIDRGRRVRRRGRAGARRRRAALSQVAEPAREGPAPARHYLPKAQRARDTVEFAYRRGGMSLLDFLDAQRTYRETSLEHLRALGGYWTALYQLETAVGGPWETR